MILQEKGYSPRLRGMELMGFALRKVGHIEVIA